MSGGQTIFSFLYSCFWTIVATGVRLSKQRDRIRVLRTGSRDDAKKCEVGIHLVLQKFTFPAQNVRNFETALNSFAVSVERLQRNYGPSFALRC
jgi:hypothetical protein